MRWFRSQGRASAWVALFALLVQFAMSFGHVHLDHPRAPSTAVSELAAVSGGQDEDHADHQACAICILSQMVSTAQTAVPPSIPLILVSHTAKQALISERIAAPPLTSAFRSRAPPAA